MNLCHIPPSGGAPHFWGLRCLTGLMLLTLLAGCNVVVRDTPETVQDVRNRVTSDQGSRVAQAHSIFIQPLGVMTLAGSASHVPGTSILKRTPKTISDFATVANAPSLAIAEYEGGCVLPAGYGAEFRNLLDAVYERVVLVRDWSSTHVRLDLVPANTEVERTVYELHWGHRAEFRFYFNCPHENAKQAAFWAFLIATHELGHAGLQVTGVADKLGAKPAGARRELLADGLVACIFVALAKHDPMGLSRIISAQEYVSWGLDTPSWTSAQSRNLCNKWVTAIRSGLEPVKE